MGSEQLRENDLGNLQCLKPKTKAERISEKAYHKEDSSHAYSDNKEEPYMADISTEQSYGIMTEIPGVARNYKDRVFRMVFKEKKALLALYNAMNGTVYEDEDALTVTTLVHRFRNNYPTHLSANLIAQA